jgi:hypothetical protein
MNSIPTTTEAFPCSNDPEKQFAIYLDSIGFVPDPRLVAITKLEDGSFPGKRPGDLIAVVGVPAQ